MRISDSYLRVTMPNGDKYDVPIMAIAMNRAKNYASEFGGDIQESLIKDTQPLFEDAHYEISDWAANNMDWDMIASCAIKVPRPDLELTPEEFQDGWVNGEKEIVSHLRKD